MNKYLLPIRLPNKIRKLKQIKPIKAYSKVSIQLLTGPEAAKKETDKAEIEVQKQVEENTIEVVSTISPGRKRTYTLIKRTPGKPPIPDRAALVLPQSPEASLSFQLPPSTAPAKLYIGKGGKEHKKTSKATIVKTEGLLPKSQPRE